MTATPASTAQHPQPPVATTPTSFSGEASSASLSLYCSVCCNRLVSLVYEVAGYSHMVGVVLWPGTQGQNVAVTGGLMLAVRYGLGQIREY